MNNSVGKEDISPNTENFSFISFQKLPKIKKIGPVETGQHRPAKSASGHVAALHKQPLF
jgi:hypothetical protein